MHSEGKAHYFKNTFLPCVASGFAVGLIVGIAVFFFKYAADFLSDESALIYGYIRENPTFIPLLFLGLAILATAEYFFQKFAPETRGGGIPRSVGVIRGIVTFRWLRTAIGTVFNSFLSYFAGLPLGTEGTSVLLGCSLGAGTAALPISGRNFSKYMMTSGACAGFAVATGAPLSGILFSVEETHKRVSSTIMLASISAILSSIFVSRLLSAALGINPAPLFGVAAETLRSPAIGEVWVMLLAGVIVGLFATGFCRLTEVLSNLFGKKCSAAGKLMRFIVLFWLVGTAGFFLEGTLYGGHGIVEKVFAGGMGPGEIALTLTIRLVLVVLCSAIGASGGLFIPMLSLGALAGALSAKLFAVMGMSAEVTPFVVLACTVSFMGASTKAPITALVFAMESTWRFTNLFYMAFTVFISYFITELTRTRSAYEFMTERMAKRQAEGKHFFYGDFKVTVTAGCFAEGKEISELLLSSNITVCKNISFEDESEVYLGNERRLREGDELIFTALMSDENAVRCELENYFGKQEWEKHDTESGELRGV